MPFDPSTPLDTALVSHLPMIIRELKQYLRNALEAEHYFADETNDKFGKHKTVNADAVKTSTIQSPDGNPIETDALKVLENLVVEGVIRVLNKLITPQIENPVATEPVSINKVAASDLSVAGSLQSENADINNAQISNLQASSLSTLSATIGDASVQSAQVNNLSVASVKPNAGNTIAVDGNLAANNVVTNDVTADWIHGKSGTQIKVNRDMLLLGNLQASRVDALEIYQNNIPVFVPAANNFLRVSNQNIVNLSVNTETDIVALDIGNFVNLNEVVLVNAVALVWIEVVPSATPLTMVIMTQLKHTADNSIVSHTYVPIHIPQHSSGVLSYPVCVPIVRFFVAPQEVQSLKLTVTPVVNIGQQTNPTIFVPVGWGRIELLKLR